MTDEVRGRHWHLVRGVRVSRVECDRIDRARGSARCGAVLLQSGEPRENGESSGRVNAPCARPLPPRGASRHGMPRSVRDEPGAATDTDGTRVVFLCKRCGGAHAVTGAEEAALTAALGGSVASVVAPRK